MPRIVAHRNLPVDQYLPLLLCFPHVHGLLQDPCRQVVLGVLRGPSLLAHLGRHVDRDDLFVLCVPEHTYTQIP